jgi:23S rRNA pseudouridine2605 synthase
LTSEQLEASRAERMRLNGHGTLVMEDARTWIEETGLCLFLPRRQYSSSIAPSFVEAFAGERNSSPNPRLVQVAEELLVRLETDGVAVRLNLLGLPGEQPDFVVASWVLPYVYALRGDRDWRRSPQLTGSRQVSQLAVQAYKLLEAGDATIPELKRALGREVTEGAVLRAITELWQQLRIIPVVSAPGQTAKWQLLRTRYQKAIAEGASTSQVTAISVLASIYLQAVIAASMEEVELFLAPLTARSKVREVLRGLVATRQVHTISLGHAPHFYVAGTLPEFAEAPTSYSSSSMMASSSFLRSRDHEKDAFEFEARTLASPIPSASTNPYPASESVTSRPPELRKPASDSKAAVARPHFSRPTTHSRDRKPTQPSNGSHPARRPSPESRTSGARRPVAGTRPAPASKRWGSNAGSSTKRNGAHSATGSKTALRPKGGAPRPSNGSSGARAAKSSAPAWGRRNGHTTGAKATAKTSATSRVSRKPALAAGAKAVKNSRIGYTSRPKQGTKKR